MTPKFIAVLHSSGRPAPSPHSGQVGRLVFWPLLIALTSFRTARNCRVLRPLGLRPVQHGVRFLWFERGDLGMVRKAQTLPAPGCDGTGRQPTSRSSVFAVRRPTPSPDSPARHIVTHRREPSPLATRRRLP